MGEKQEENELLEQLQRIQAEFENYKKRVERETQSIRKRACEQLLRDLLPILDNLSLALTHAKDKSGKVDPKELMQGLLMVEDQFASLLQEQGLEKIQTDGPFDPKMHEAVQTVQDTKKKQNSIVDTIQKGYTLAGKVLRPAKVTIVKNKEA